MPGDPHEAAPNEDPEQHIGAKMPDPWEDEGQKDWTTQTLVITEEVTD